MEIPPYTLRSYLCVSASRQHYLRNYHGQPKQQFIEVFGEKVRNGGEYTRWDASVQAGDINIQEQPWLKPL